MIKNSAPGEQELEALRFIADHAPISVGEVAQRYGEPKGLARTTILTMMERLRKKGLLTRTKVSGVFRYSPQQVQSDLMIDLVRDFVSRTLNGSISPFVAYLSESGEVSPEEFDALKQLVAQLNDAGKEQGK